MKNQTVAVLITVTLLFYWVAFSQTHLNLTQVPAGTGASIEPDTGTVLAGGKLGVDTATVPTFFTGTASLQFASVGPACAEQTFPLLNAATGDAVIKGFPRTLESGVYGEMIAGFNTITVRLCRNTPGSVANQVFRATIIRPF